jgi:hypothetical protein
MDNAAVLIACQHGRHLSTGIYRFGHAAAQANRGNSLEGTQRIAATRLEDILIDGVLVVSGSVTGNERRLRNFAGHEAIFAISEETSSEATSVGKIAVTLVPSLPD